MSVAPAVVLDASAVIAFLFDEEGSEQVADRLFAGGALMGAANWSEVVQKVVQRGQDWDLAKGLLSALVGIEPVTADDAESAALAWAPGSGLSLGDRLCLALGERAGVPILTADRAWAGRQGVVLIR
jgi:PIN domain nuclease of toxin-antitoxin system